jgi:hypothetical protein
MWTVLHCAAICGAELLLGGRSSASPCYETDSAVGGYTVGIGGLETVLKLRLF